MGELHVHAGRMALACRERQRRRLATFGSGLRSSLLADPGRDACRGGRGYAFPPRERPPRIARQRLTRATGARTLLWTTHGHG